MNRLLLAATALAFSCGRSGLPQGPLCTGECECVASDPVALSEPFFSSEAGLTVDEDTAYWGEPELGSFSGAVMSASLSGTVPALTLATGLSPIGNPVADADELYFFNRRYCGSCTSRPTLSKVALVGGDIVTLPGPGAVVSAGGLEAVAGEVVWGAYTMDALGNSTYGMFGLKRDDTAPFTLPAPEQHVVDAANVYWVDSSGALDEAAISGGATVTLATAQWPSAIAVDATRVYFLESIHQELRAISINGGEVVTLAPATGDSLAVGSTEIAWADSKSGAISAIAVTGGTAHAVARNQRPSRLTVAPSGIYWVNASADGTSSSIWRADFDGCASVPIVKEQPVSIVQVAFDSRGVTWLTSSTAMNDIGTGSVYRAVILGPSP